MTKYNHTEIEKKWQQIWAETNLYRTSDDPKKPKFYCLDMFPYPSGAGLHVGHPKGYIATDVFSRFKTHQGYKVLHPMGWDAFGLPAENYAIKNKVHPSVAVNENVKRFKDQLGQIGFNYDWSREINTTDPEFYKWTQWIFLKLFEKGLAYQSYEPINWCPSCQTGLSMEDLEDGKCERCGGDVEQKPMRQWVLKITDYADRLLDDLKLLDWEGQIIEQQRNWIGRSEGARVKFAVSDSNEIIEVFTTRIDTLYGATFMVLAPEHPLVEHITTKDQKSKVEKYIAETKKKTNLERQQEKKKTGVFTGAYAINPINNEKIPVWISDYVLMGYGTGAIMAVPAHDERDYEFAQKFDLPVREVIVPFTRYNPQEDKETEERDLAVAIVYNPKNDSYLCLDWKKTGWHSFPAGGTDGEKFEIAAKRELIEETGYKNVKLVKEYRNTLMEEFYRPHKDSNVIARYKYMIFELVNEERAEVDEKEKNQHEAVWVKKSEVADFLNIEHLKIFWAKYLSGNVEELYSDYGRVMDSGEFSGLSSEDAKEAIIKKLTKESKAQKAVSYKMKDWVFSRQRYWGEPIPVVHCEECGPVAVPEPELPLTLPDVESYEPSGTGESPLANITEWVSTKCPKCGGKAKRETDTMPQWAGSSWYYLRYIDPQNGQALVDKKLEKEWMPVDLYVGGIEHATRHLLYARFWHKFLYDIGAVSTIEPFKKLIHVGLILAEDGRKMSKRWNNVVNPDEIVAEYGADALRVYEMFMGPFTQYVAWSTAGVKGARKFLEKVVNLADVKFAEISTAETEVRVNKLIKKVTEDIEGFRFNTAIAAFMEFTNFLTANPGTISKVDFEKFLVLLNSFAPHLTEELWEKLGNKESICLAAWPTYDQKLTVDEIIGVAVQVDGKVRDTLLVSRDATEDELLKLAKGSEKVQKYLESGIKKSIYVKGKILSIVTN